MKNKIVEWKGWFYVCAVLLVGSIVFAQLDTAAKEKIVNDLKAVVVQVDTEGKTTSDEQTAIAEKSARIMLADINNNAYQKCMAGCRSLILRPTTTTTIGGGCTKEQTYCVGEVGIVCCNADEVCKSGTGCQKP